jgi:hypothetical protein
MLGISPYRAVNTFNHGYKKKSVDDLKSKGHCPEIHTKHSMQSEHHVEFLNVKPGGT